MKTFFVFGIDGSEDKRENLIAIADGFSFLAFLVAPFWFLWRGMWLHALVSAIVLSATSLIPIEALAYSVSFLAMLWFGFEARFLHLEHLQKTGFTLLDQHMADDSDLACEIYLARNDKTPMKAAETRSQKLVGSKTPEQDTGMFFGRS